MESAVRYDFSFPPKSSSMSNGGATGINPSGTQYTIHPNLYVRQQPQDNAYTQSSTAANSSSTVGLSRSASTSLLTCASTTNNNHNHNNNNPKLNNNYCNSCNNCKENVPNAPINNNTLQNNLNLAKSNCGIKNAHFSAHTNKPTSLVLLQNQNGMGQMSHAMGAPATPKDSNCSFTFDDLKNTLAFMEDSPLVSSNNNNAAASVNAVNNPNVLMVIPNAISSSDSSLSSSSSTSSSSTSSCASCYTAGGYLPKSNSNPMLLSAGSSSSSSSSSNTCSTSPSSSQSKKTDCVCAISASTGNLNTMPHQFHAQPTSNSVLDLFIKKSNQETMEANSYEPYATNGSLITTAAPGSGINTLLTSVQPQPTNYNAIETAAKKYRCAAQISEATCCWKGKLPPKQYKTPIVYSTKVFVGGLPWDITEDDLFKEFGVFGSCRVEWTNKEKFNMMGNVQIQQSAEMPFEQNNSNNNGPYNTLRNARSMTNFSQQQKQPNNAQQGNNNNNNNNNDPLNSSKHRLSPGFAYVIYDSEYSVRSLVGNCIEDYQNGRDRVEYYFKISTRRVRNKEVQIIPWILADNNFALCTPKELDPKKTVFVGNLHGTMTARDLAHIMNELFGCVVYAGIDIDKLKYPIGSGRVTFSHQQNFMRAVRAAFVDIQSSKFSKRIQIDPYLEDVQCCLCYADKGVYFCRDFQCFNYYCGLCWDKQHSYNQLGNHKPLMRKREDKI